MAQTICSGTKLLKLLFARLKKDGFDENKLYASEVVAILLQVERERERERERQRQR